ncbi:MULTISPECIES: restriction endonuclease subunit S [Nocardia]|uniref:restriction endonuclease subunit S n=1 Tax=Nocardia TaxID=1817 RepID=UPI001CBF3E74|nr:MULTISPECIES: restriction endonuclease subunit S [Nocardia]
MFYKRFKPGHVLYVSRRTYLRKVAVPDFMGITGEKTFVLEAINPDILLQEFLPFVLSAEVFHSYAIKNSRGSVNPYLNWGELARYEFELPPLNEQRRIAELLWATERHSVNLTESVAQIAAGKSLFFAELMEYGTRERGWPSEPVTAVVTSGPTNGKSATANTEQLGVPTLSISAIRDGHVHGGESVKWIEVAPPAVAAFQLERNDFLIVRGNGNRTSTGRGGLVTDGLPEGCIYPDLLIRLKFDESRVMPAFASEQWNSASVHTALLRKAKSTNGIWKINGKDIKTHRLVIPPVSDQVAILENLATFDAALQSARMELAALDALRARALDEVSGVN